MSSDNFSDGVLKPRTVLGDVTNWKRKIDDVVSKSGDLCHGEKLHKRVCLGVETAGGEKYGNKCAVDKSGMTGIVSGITHAKGDTLQENIGLVVLDECKESEDVIELMDDDVGLGKSSKVIRSVDNAGDEVRCSGAFSSSIPVSSKMCKDVDDRLKDLPRDDVGELGNSEIASNEGFRFPNSQESVKCGLARCTTLKDDGPGDLNASDNCLESCSCSFCLTAAYIWSDLYYQDVKGRIAAVKKSQKEATTLVNRYAKGKHTELKNLGSEKNNTTLEMDLARQWGSLFHHMEDIYIAESHQLQTNFQSFKDLRQSCKMDLESKSRKDSHN